MGLAATLGSGAGTGEVETETWQCPACRRSSASVRLGQFDDEDPTRWAER